MMISRLVPFVAVGLGMTALAGCPIYSDDGGGYRGTGGGRSCASSADCSHGETCGANRTCQATDCRIVGCAAPFVCQLSNASTGPRCVLPKDPSVCSKDQDCATQAGEKCLNGACVAPSNQCSDGTQCKNGAACVDGACVPSCSADKPCPTGYACDTERGVCTENPNECGGSAGCTGGTVCVESRCVAPCGEGGACDGGLVCVNGGCVPDERPVQDCDVDGQQDKCREGSICLRHSCYIACETDAGADAGDDICKSADAFNVCKPVTTSSGTHHVCGSDKNLGDECDPAQNKTCTGALICVDGYCR